MKWGASENFVRTNEKWSRFLKSGLKVKSQNQKKITIKLNCLFFQKSFAKRKQNEYFLR